MRWTELFARQMLQEMRGCLCHGGAFIYNQARQPQIEGLSEAKAGERHSVARKVQRQKKSHVYVYKYSVN